MPQTNDESPIRAIVPPWVAQAVSLVCLILMVGGVCHYLGSGRSLFETNAPAANQANAQAKAASVGPSVAAQPINALQAIQWIRDPSRPVTQRRQWLVRLGHASRQLPDPVLAELRLLLNDLTSNTNQPAELIELARDLQTRLTAP